MAKRYHNSKKGKMHAEMRRGNESSGMIHDDRSAPCNLPQHVIEKYWPVAYNGNMGMVEDLFNGVQKQLHEDYSDLGKAMGPKKY